MYPVRLNLRVPVVRFMSSFFLCSLLQPFFSKVICQECPPELLLIEDSRFGTSRSPFLRNLDI